MNVSLFFIRIFFVIISIFFMMTYMLSLPPEGSMTINGLIGLGIGCAFSFLLMVFDTIFRRFNLRAFNIAIIGLFIGYLMGQVLVLIFDAVLDISKLSIVLTPKGVEIIRIALFLFGTYLGSIMTLRSSDELYVSIPFVKFAPTMQKKRDLLLDPSTLSDVRLIDICETGIFDQLLVIPRFALREFYAQIESEDIGVRTRAQRALEVVKKMEQNPKLGMRIHDADFPEIADPYSKLARLARLIEANILTAKSSRVEMPPIEGVQIISLQALSNACKPLMEKGEIIKIKVQREGRESRQGVGYFEDGTMVVINGGGDFIGEVIEAQVLSVKHTSSGRMVFCNALDGDFETQYVDPRERPKNPYYDNTRM